jgi:hypothetical protein
MSDEKDKGRGVGVERSTVDDVGARSVPDGGVVDGGSARRTTLPRDARRARTVLVVDRPGSDRQEACRAFFADRDLGEVNVLVVSLTGSAQDRIDAFDDHGLDVPNTLTVISPGGASGGSRTETVGTGGKEVTVRTLKDPAELPKLGMQVTRTLDGWGDAEILICFDSLTELLRNVDLERVYRFVQVLSDRLSTEQAWIHVHLEGDAFDDRTLAALRPLFDAVFEAPTDVEPR